MGLQAGTNEMANKAMDAAKKMVDPSQQAIDAAKAAHKKAKSVEGGWVSTSKLIKKAEAAAAKGDKAKAMQLADKAQKEAELSYKQAMYEKDNWAPPPYIR